MDVPFYISKRTDPLRDRTIFKKRNSEAPNAASNGYITPQPTVTRPSHLLDCKGPASPWTAPAAGLASQQPAWSPHGNSASEFNRSEIARQIRANFDSLVRASPLPRGTAAMHLQQPEPDQPDSEVRQAVYALNLSGGEEPNRLPEALLETANACQPQERGAAGALSPFLGLHGAGEGSTAAPLSSTAASGPSLESRQDINARQHEPSVAGDPEQTRKAVHSTSGADVSEQKAAASTQSEEAQDGQKQSLGKKRKLASASADASKKRPAKSRADLAAKQEPNLHASTANGVSDGHLQVSRTGRVRVKPLAFWANQRLSRDALAIDQGFSDQLAQQCHSFVQQPRQRLAAPSPAKAQPGSGDKALSGSQSDPPSSKPAAPQKGGKTGDSLGKGMKRPAAEPIEAAKAHSKKSRAQDSGTTGKKPVGKEERKTAPKETKLVDSPIRPRIAVAGQQGAAAGARADKGGGAVAAAKQRPGLRRLRKAADAPRDDAVELAAAARDLQDYEDEAEEVSAAQLLAQRFSPGKAEKPAAGKEAKSRKAKKRTANSGTDGQDTRSGDAHEGKSGPSGACEADVATPVRGPLDEEDDEEDADGWTRTQRDALQRAHAKEDPTGNAFWQRVAQQVPGKDAKQCFSKFWAGNPTPALACTGGPRAYLAAAAASSPLAPPARTTATGNARKLPAAATRKWARQVRWQERASQGGAACEDAAEAKGPDAKSRAGLNPCLVAAMQRAERTDKYIDAIIKKRGNPQRWQSGSMAKGSGRSHTGLVESAPADISRRPALVDSTVAAIASSAQVVPESDDESERDEYWSGDDSDS
ncbi:hypothetical protein WJX75_008716 [Coccomyxa subellipsoidea]|uniref:Myb-like domain-containing protein n=1 Tax=Coccomyxa subellipsoidea TaxID=248742 RepID=A0ABR2YYG5_9CHLO